MLAEDLYKFDPRAWTNEIEIYTEVNVRGRQKEATVLIPRLPESPGSTDWPRQVESYAIKHYKTVHWAEGINVEHLERSMGDAIREGWLLTPLVAPMVVLHLAKVYLGRLEQDGLPNQFETLSDIAIERAIKFQTKIIQPLMATIADDCSHWFWLHQLAWTRTELEHEIGESKLSKMDEAELESIFDAQLLEYLNPRTVRLLNFYAQDIAGLVVESFNLPARSLAGIASLLALEPQEPKFHPGAVHFRDGHLSVIAAGAYHGLQRALAESRFGLAEDSPWPTATLQGGGAKGFAQLRPPTLEDQPLTSPEYIEELVQLMWRQRAELSDLDADVLDLLSHIWIDRSRGLQTSAWAEVDELLQMRGIQPRWDKKGYRSGYREKDRAQMLKALTHIQSLWLTMTEMDVTWSENGRRKRQQQIEILQSRAFMITDRLGQLRTDGYMDVRRFIFRPGEVFARFLSGPGRQTALMSAKAVEYDPYRQTWEKRLTRYLSWQWRVRAHSSSYHQSYRVSTLLGALGSQANLRRISSIKERLEKALETLEGDKVIVGWQYEGWVDPLSYKRGWALDWLDAKIQFEPPDEIREQYRSIERHEVEVPRALHRVALLTEQLHQERTRQNLTLMQVAEDIGITAAYLSSLEHGKRSRPSSKIINKMEQWLEKARFN